MIFLAMTKPKKKLWLLIKVALIILLLALVLPSMYNSMVGVNALERFSQYQKTEEEYPGEPMRVDVTPTAMQTVYVDEIADIFYAQ